MQEELGAEGEGEEMGLNHSTRFGFGLVCSDGVSLYRPGWSAVVRSQFTITSTSWVQVIFLSQPPE